MQPLNNITSEISTTNGSSGNTNLLDSLGLSKFDLNDIQSLFFINIMIKYHIFVLR